MKEVIISLAVFIIVLTISVSAIAQQEISYQDTETFSEKSFYFLMGYTQGPYFDDYVDWINQYYRDNFTSNDIMNDFDGGFSFSAGFRNRFTRYFAFDFDFAFHSMRIKKTYYGTQVGFQDLQMNVAIFTGSVPIILEFYDNQLLVPFIAAGISIFSLRLDHTINWGERHIKTAIAGNFSIGCEIKLTQKLYADLRADWTLGKVKMPVTQIVGQPDNFNLSLDTTQLQIGILYGFR
jgi:hypothetical protein